MYLYDFGNFLFWPMGIYIHKIVTINNQFNYFSTVYFKKKQDKEWALSLKWLEHMKADGMQRQTAYSTWLKLTRWQGHVTLNVQNGSKRLPSSVAVGGFHKERDSIQQTTEADWLRSDFKCTGLSKTRPPSHVLVTLVAYTNVLHTHLKITNLKRFFGYWTACFNWNWYDRVPLQFIMTFILFWSVIYTQQQFFWYYYIFLVHQFLTLSVALHTAWNTHQNLKHATEKNYK
jgi:hypothetical protein